MKTVMKIMSVMMTPIAMLTITSTAVVVAESGSNSSSVGIDSSVASVVASSSVAAVDGGKPHMSGSDVQTALLVHKVYSDLLGLRPVGRVFHSKLER